MIKPLRLAENFVVVDQDFASSTVAVTDSLWSEIDEKYGDFSGHSLISCFAFDNDWPTWEIHPAGDEFVCLLEGDAELILALPGGDKALRLFEPGTFVVVPRNTWHTARVSEPTKMLFVTPGQGTINAEHPERNED